MIESIEAGTVGKEDAGFQPQNLIIYPNPSNGNFTLGGLTSGDQVAVFDSSGRIILKKVSGYSILQLSINPPGLYMVEIRRQHEVQRKKLIIR
jgi:hypothetical protein